MSNLAAIGFDVASPEEFGALAEQAAMAGEQVDVGRGGLVGRRRSYIRFQAGGGPELWVQATGRALIGLVPHFAGEARMPLRLDGELRRQDESPLDGAFSCVLDLGGGEGPTLVLDAPDFLAALDALGPERPLDVDAQIAAFALDAAAHADDAAFAAAQGDAGPGLAAQSLIPVGAFEEGDPSAVALLAGTVEATALRENPITGAPYRWVRLATLGGTLDVVAAPGDIAGEPVEGGIVAGTFWLSARLAADA